MAFTGLADQVAIVTGAAQGIGQAVAAALAQHGSKVALVDRNEAALAQAIAELAARGMQGHAFPADVSDSRSVEAAVDRIERELGAIHCLANVAGVLRPGSITACSDEDWAQTFAVNATGVFYTSRAVARRMIPRRAGAIVTVSSNAASVPRMQMAAYAASKAAATHFSKCLALELAPHRIRCNIVSPGTTRTAMLETLRPADESAAEAAARSIAGSPETYRTGIPLQRLAMPSDLAEAVLFLLSDQARHITMHDLRVDGGATLGA